VIKLLGGALSVDSRNKSRELVFEQLNGIDEVEVTRTSQSYVRSVGTHSSNADHATVHLATVHLARSIRNRHIL
jgi:hypothetical protein